MDWSKVKKTPTYNPFMFEIARHSRGWTRHDLKLKTRLPLSAISQIENGNTEPTKEQVSMLAEILDFPESFFQQWWKTELDLSGPLAKNVPIDYYKYKVFRNLNPPILCIV